MVNPTKSQPSSPMVRPSDAAATLLSTPGADRPSSPGHAKPNSPVGEQQAPTSLHPHAAGDRATFFHQMGMQPDTPDMVQLLALLQRLRDTAQKILEIAAEINRINHPDAASQTHETAEASTTRKFVDVTLGMGSQAKVHRLEANLIDIPDNTDSAVPTRYLAGRTPAPVQAETIEVDTNQIFQPAPEYQKTLVQAIESGQGLYQFVWPKTHQASEDATEQSIFQLLETALRRSREDNVIFCLGGRYRVEQLQKVPGKELAAGSDYFHYQLTVFDLEKNKQLIVPMTQAGLPLANGRLAPDQIIRSHQILESHRTLLTKDLSATKPPTEPLILSNKGRIRNATLIAFTSVYKRIYNLSINTPEEIDEAIHQAVSAGYEARGVRNFIPSKTQIAMLRAALIKGLKDRPMPEAPTDADVQQMARTIIPAARRSEKARSFSAMAFALRDNKGGGNCLFHSLAGTRSEPNLPDSSSALRDEIAAYVEGLPDTTQRSCNNWHSISIALLQKSSDRFTEFVARHPMDKDKVLSNRDFAMYVRVLGLFCGNDEIQLWLDLPRNVNRTVALVDGQYGQEQITHFRHRIPSKTFMVTDIPGGEAEVRRKVGDAIAAAVNDEQNPACEVPTHLAIYRSNLHFQRIVGQYTMEEQAENVREANKKFAELEELSKNMTAEDIAKLGT